MAITKQAKNVTIEVISNYKLGVGQKLEKTAEKLNVEATAGDLALSCIKKIVSSGNK